MAFFIPVDARADVADSKKGKMTPSQHAQLNAWMLTKKTGILDFGGKCESDPLTYSVSGNSARVFFNGGFVVICGRLVECEAGSYVDVTAPATGTVSGNIILRFNLRNAGTTEFEATTTTDPLVQDDINDDPVNGVYEFPLYSYTATASTVTLSRDEDYVIPVEGIMGTGFVNTGNPPLQGYDLSKGTIEERLTQLGFKEASITAPNGDAVGSLRRQGNFVIGYVSFTTSETLPVFETATGYDIVPTIGTVADFEPSTEHGGAGGTHLIHISFSNSTYFQIRFNNVYDNKLWVVNTNADLYYIPYIYFGYVAKN